MSIYKPKKLNNDGSLEDVKFPLDCLDGSEDLTFSEMEISETVSETATNLVIGKGVYNAIKNANHGYILEITASQHLNDIPYFTIPSLSTTDVENLAKAYTQQKPTFIHYDPAQQTAPPDGSSHYYRVDSANYGTSASSNFVAEVHIHVDLDIVSTIGESLCLEILYQSNGSTVSVRSNPNILYQTTSFFNEVNEELPALSGLSITSIVNESIVGDITKIMGYDDKGYIEITDVISRGINDNIVWITFCWKNKIYKMSYGSDGVSAELLDGEPGGKGTLLWSGEAEATSDLNFSTYKNLKIIGWVGYPRQKYTIEHNISTGDDIISTVVSGISPYYLQAVNLYFSRTDLTNAKIKAAPSIQIFKTSSDALDIYYNVMSKITEVYGIK